jgi:signal transduction histidine kinase
MEKAEKRERQSIVFSRETLKALEQERSRIARELHDTVAQDLWRLSFQTDSIDKKADPGERSRLCGEVTSGQKELMRRIRNLCDYLIPPDFQRRGLADSLKSLCYDFRQRTGIECLISVQEGLQLGIPNNEPTLVGMQLQCFRIVQECLTNIEKHSGASEASVLVRYKDANSGSGELLIYVSDNGRGFSPPLLTTQGRDSFNQLRAEGHFGLWNMNERAAALAGTMSLDSEAGEGTVITLRIPLPESRQEL